MARRRFRLRVWMLMALVTASAVGMGGWRMYRLRRTYQVRAAMYAEQERLYSSLAAISEDGIVSARQSLAKIKAKRDKVAFEDIKQLLDRSEARRLERLDTWSKTYESDIAHRDYCAGLARKYRRASRYPWLPVAPDPPEPE